MELNFEPCLKKKIIRSDFLAIKTKSGVIEFWFEGNSKLKIDAINNSKVKIVNKS